MASRSVASLLACTALVLGGSSPALLRPSPARAAAAAPDRVVPRGRPNIVLIVADDLGYSDIGAFGGEIRTPNLDALARRGVRLTNFHTAPQCSATRAMLITGADPHQVGLGSGLNEVPDPALKGKPGYEGTLSENSSSIAELLREGGYRTMMAGKWHLGLSPQSGPAARGFSRSFALLTGADNHFGKRYTVPQGNADWPILYAEDGRPVEALPDDFYSSDFFTSKLLSYLDEGRKDPAPFFAYLAFSAPHYPIQAPPEDIARYRGKYDEGWEKIRNRRIAKARAQGIISKDEAVHPVVGARDWNKLDAKERAVEARKMETYAAMVDRLDQNVGRLIRHLKSIGEYENSIFVFMADNGAEGFAMEQSSKPEHAAMGRQLLARGNNDLESLGSARSYFWYGPQWGQVSSAPGYYHKHYPTEGGTRVVSFVTRPGGRARRGVGNAFASAMDLAPTMLEWAGIRRGADGKTPYLGESMAPYLAGKAGAVHGQSYGMGTEFWGRRSYRMGDWKIVHIPKPEGPGRWQLFDMKADPNETVDVAAGHQEIMKRLLQGWDDYAAKVGFVMPASPGL